MGDGDDQKQRPRSRFPKRERVTLKWETLPLALPGEPAGGDEDDESVELALPDVAAEGEPERVPSIPPPGEPLEGADGWERQRARLTPPPFRPVSQAAASLLDEDDGGALDLVDRRSRPASQSGDLVVEMSDRHALGDYTAALRAAELILGREPAHEAAQRIAKSCRERLTMLYGSRLGSLARVPTVAVVGEEVRWLGLDHRAAFLLSRVDGQHTLAELVDVSGMPALEALKTLVELLEMGAIGFRD